MYVWFSLYFPIFLILHTFISIREKYLCSECQGQDNLMKVMLRWSEKFTYSWYVLDRMPLRKNIYVYFGGMLIQVDKDSYSRVQNLDIFLTWLLSTCIHNYMYGWPQYPLDIFHLLLDCCNLLDHYSVLENHTILPEEKVNIKSWNI